MIAEGSEADKLRAVGSPRGNFRCIKLKLYPDENHLLTYAQEARE